MNERLTADEVNARRWPHGAVVRDDLGRLGMHDGGHWYGRSYDTDVLAPSAEPYTVVHPVPEPDHSMCARLVRHPDDSANRHGLQSPNGSYLTLPHDGPVFVAPDDYWRDRGYAIPAPEPTVVERAAKVLAETEVDEDGKVTWRVAAQALAAAGLLARDGEQ